MSEGIPYGQCEACLVTLCTHIRTHLRLLDEQDHELKERLDAFEDVVEAARIAREVVYDAAQGTYHKKEARVILGKLDAALDAMNGKAGA